MIYVHATYIKITNYQENKCPQLERALSVWDNITFSYSFSAFLIDKEKEELIIPGGFNLNYLRKLLPEEKIKNLKNELDDYRVVLPYNLKFGPKNITQSKAIDFLMDYKKNKNPQKFLNLRTGEGKTYCCINYCSKVRKLPIVILDQNTLLQQWKQSILKFTDIDETDIYIISGKKSVEKLLSMSIEELSNIKFILAIHRTLNSLFNTDIELLKRLFEEIKIGIKIFDEAHIEWINIFYLDCITNTETIYLTATPQRTNHNEQKVYRNMIYSISIFKSELTNRYLNVVKYLTTTKCPTDVAMTFRSKRGFDIIGYCKYFVESKAFKSSLEDTLTSIFRGDFTKNKKIAIIYRMKQHLLLAKEIVEDLINSNNGTITIGVLNGDTKNKEDVLKSNIMITTDASFIKGIDVPDLEVVINFVPIVSDVRITQVTGRLRELEEKEVFYIDVVDESVNDILKQFSRRKTYYNKVAKKIYNMKGKELKHE